jgi:hypothetical protein
VPKTNDKTFPFTKEHIETLKKEITEAGSFNALMFRKSALQRKKGMMFIRTYRNIEKYKSKFLTGVYEPLRPMYDTEIPYVFWNALYELLPNSNNKQR